MRWFRSIGVMFGPVVVALGAILLMIVIIINLNVSAMESESRWVDLVGLNRSRYHRVLYLVHRISYESEGRLREELLAELEQAIESIDHGYEEAGLGRDEVASDLSSDRPIPKSLVEQRAKWFGSIRGRLKEFTDAGETLDARDEQAALARLDVAIRDQIEQIERQVEHVLRLREERSQALTGRILVLDGVGVSLCGLVGLFGWMQFRRLVSLIEAAERIARGEAQEPVSERPDDELGRLGSALNRITDRVRAIEQQSQDLENRLLEIPLGETADLIDASDAPSTTIIPNQILRRPTPTRLRCYELIEPLGSGGMGVVYKAWHTLLNRAVALKVLAIDRNHDERAIARFRREMVAIGKLDHPHIIRASDAGEEDGLLFLVMELADGLDLMEVIRRLGPLDPIESGEIIRQAAVGLDYIHSHQLIHRDVKPSNLFLSSDGLVKIFDLGLALLYGEERTIEDVSVSGQVLGSVDYIAPEQASDMHHVDYRADLYSLGCTFYLLLKGRPPFNGDRYPTVVRKLMAHCQVPAPSINDGEGPEVPAPIAALLERMLAKRPDDRPTSAREIAEQLQPLTAGVDLTELLQKARRAESKAAACAVTLDEPRFSASSTCSLRGAADPEGDSNPSGNPPPSDSDLVVDQKQQASGIRQYS